MRVVPKMSSRNEIAFKVVSLNTYRFVHMRMMWLQIIRPDTLASLEKSMSSSSGGWESEVDLTSPDLRVKSLILLMEFTDLLHFGSAKSSYERC